MVDGLVKACGTNKIFALFDENTDLVSNISSQKNKQDTSILYKIVKNIMGMKSLNHSLRQKGMKSWQKISQMSF